MSDQVTGFIFENNIAHGAFVELSGGVKEMLGHRHYGDDVRRLIGEAMAAMPLLATHQTFEGRINLQFQGDGGKGLRSARRGDQVTPPHMSLLVAQIDDQLRVRGMAKAPPELKGDFKTLLFGGILALMLEPSAESQRLPSQALVMIEGERLSEALEGYFNQSEQLPTLIRLVSRGDRLAGFLLQRLPLEHTQATQDDWEHLETLAATLTEDELLSTEPATMLRRLFGEAPIRLFEPRPVTVACRCSPASIEAMLVSLGVDEVQTIVAEQGQVEITCEFCGRQHRYAPADVQRLFAAAGAKPTETRH
jgi:molecular chaperone Hsp33